jgi:uncharacterized protein YxjI
VPGATHSPKQPYVGFRMKFVMTQKLMSFGDDFWIRDERGHKVYKVNGAVYAFGNKLTLKDLSGRLLAEVRQRLFTLRPTYRIFVRGEVFAVLYKKIFAFRRSYVIKTRHGMQFRVKGGLVFNDYQIEHRDHLVAQISKKIGTFADTYEIEMRDSEDPVFILCCALIIDLIEHDKVKGGRG